MLRRGPVVVLTFLLAACNSVRQQIDRDFVKAPRDQIAAPADLGLAAEAVTIPVPGSTLHGLFVPATGAAGATVVLCHGNHLNASMTFPWYSFLHEAGFHVLTFDPRGFGQSPGEPGLQAWIQDTEAVLAWVRRRPEVDPAKVSVYGIGLGGVAAIYASGRSRNVSAIVVESLISPREHIRAAFGEGLGAAMQTGFVEASGMPAGSEPDEAVLQTQAPLLLLSGADEILLDRRASLRTKLVAGDRASLWVLPGTGPSPNVMMTHDGEYQAAVIAFLRGAGKGDGAQLTTTWRTTAAGEGGMWLDVTVQRGPGAGSEPWAVQICSADREAGYDFQRVWLEGQQGTFRIKVPAEPGMVTAVRYRSVLGKEDGSGWTSPPPTLARAGALWQKMADDADLLKNGEPTIVQVRQVANRFQGLEQEAAFPPILEARAAEAFWLLGKRLSGSSDAEDRARGHLWLRRAANAGPEQPQAWFWPGTSTLFGFPHADAVKSASELLGRSEGR